MKRLLVILIMVDLEQLTPNDKPGIYTKVFVKLYN